MTDSEFIPTQDPDTVRIMNILRRAREEAGDSYKQAAERIEAASRQDQENGKFRWLHRISGDEYRAMEQGITKNVPLWVVMYLAHEYRISAERLVGDTLAEYIYG